MPRNKTRNTVQKTHPPPPAAPTHIPTKSNIANVKIVKTKKVYLFLLLKKV